MKVIDQDGRAKSPGYTGMGWTASSAPTLFITKVVYDAPAPSPAPDSSVCGAGADSLQVVPAGATKLTRIEARLSWDYLDNSDHRFIWTLSVPVPAVKAPSAAGIDAGQPVKDADQPLKKARTPRPFPWVVAGALTAVILGLGGTGFVYHGRKLFHRLIRVATKLDAGTLKVSTESGEGWDPCVRVRLAQGAFESKAYLAGREQEGNRP